MYTYHEIKLQNKQDAFSAMYMHLSRSIQELCGVRTGEGVIRKAVRCAGADSGLAQLQKFRRMNMRTNLHSLCHCASDLADDPRVRKRRIADEEDRQIWEVYTCPLADYWRRNRCEKLGSFYCEEFQRARVAAFTENAGQLNLSKKLTRPEDNFCCFAAFFREANMPPARAREAFSRDDAACAGPKEPLAAAGFDESIRNLTISIYCRLYESAEERCGGEGVCAISLGLRAWAGEAGETPRMQAAHPLRAMDASFLRENFPLSAGGQADNEWEQYASRDARLLMERLVLDPLAAACV